LGLIVGLFTLRCILIAIFKLIIFLQGNYPNEYVVKIERFLSLDFLFVQIIELGLEGCIDFLVVIFLSLSNPTWSISGEIIGTFLTLILILILLLMIVATIRMV
jgi:hypothetical protein